MIKKNTPEKIPTIKADCPRHGGYEFPAYDEKGFHKFHQIIPDPCPKCVADPLPFLSTNIYIQHSGCPQDLRIAWQEKTGQVTFPFFKPTRQISWENMAVVLECPACGNTIRLNSYMAEVKNENPR